MTNTQTAARTATITREFERWAYPKNGNLSNPTPYFKWIARIDGENVNGSDRTLASAKAFLAEYFGITNPAVVRAPLPRNPYTRSGKVHA